KPARHRNGSSGARAKKARAKAICQNDRPPNDSSLTSTPLIEKTVAAPTIQAAPCRFGSSVWKRWRALMRLSPPSALARLRRLARDPAGPPLARDDRLAMCDVERRGRDDAGADPGPEVGNLAIEQVGEERDERQLGVVEGQHRAGVGHLVGAGEGDVAQHPDEADQGDQGERPPARP